MKAILILMLCLTFMFKINAQTNWFKPYDDSSALVNDANEIIHQFQARVKKGGIEMIHNVAVKNTKPYLIFIRNTKVNLPFWVEVIPQQKSFFYEVAGGEKQGIEVFGLFFNGFYLTHELSHSLAEHIGIPFSNAYDSEFEANKMAILYWRAVGESQNLKKCYVYAKKMLETLKNPVPASEDYKKYITDNYQKLASDPYKYGYIQFSQFVEIYEDESLPDFDSFIKTHKK